MAKKKRNNKDLKIVAGIIVIVFAVMVVLAITAKQSETYQYDVGSPGKGSEAPNIMLPATDGTTFDLSDYEGQQVLLYFQEGIMCQACWVQLEDIESNFSRFRDLGIDHIVTITTDSLGALTSMVEMNNFQSLVLSDEDVSISSLYNTNLYGMPGMGPNYNGHTFILVDENGIITWRADYGKYTMYVPISTLEEELKRERQ